MLKLMLCLVCAFVIGTVALQLRQQELELRHQATDLHQKIQAKQSKLWSQQVEIAVYTAPNAISKSLGEVEWRLKPERHLPEGAGAWMGKKKSRPRRCRGPVPKLNQYPNSCSAV